MESWIISLCIAVIGVVGTYAVLRSRVTRLESDYEQHLIESSEYKKDTQKRLDAGFKRIDGLNDRITVLEINTEKLLDLETAEEKFITRIEMQLHLDKIEIVANNTNRDVTLLMGKQDIMLGILNQIKDRN